MSGLATPRVRIPRTVRAGEAFEVRTLMEHPMETGLRQDGGRTVARNMLARLAITVEGKPVFEAAFRNGTAANPFHVVHLRLSRTADLVFTWTDEAGRTASTTHRVTVT
ncbi:thiosulfate oxidation carrier complex protein SoxZ [Elioraea sp.]|uniref:thiosulfate oxidation carrier complex protein SoxZ n=1 Tax=Elioraea sp. TaxID=2185103 RepID=UPI0025BF5F83|nr:thiosulfate oxidation carrier complex protein SoxZ [Elioraea sp.]